jgi:hypothetical protein
MAVIVSGKLCMVLYINEPPYVPRRVTSCSAGRMLAPRRGVSVVPGTPFGQRPPAATRAGKRHARPVMAIIPRLIDASAAMYPRGGEGAS